MVSQRLGFLAMLSVAAAQNSGNTSLADALSSQNSTLSSLNGLLQTQPDLLGTLGNLTNITILAPSNDALSSFLNTSAVSNIADFGSGLIRALLSYHVLNGTFASTNISSTPAFVETLLSNQTYENVTGGQVVEAVKDGDTVSFYSGLRERANVTTADLNFTGGVIHIIDKVLRIPENLTSTAIAANLSAVVGALTQAKLGNTVDDLTNVTVFAPNNAAFAEIGSVVGNLSSQQLSSILQYHVVQGTVGYSSLLKNGTKLKTLEGTDANVVINNGSVFINEAQVVIPDILISNGVLHVVDGVLNPNNTGGEASPSNTSPAFSGATSASDVGVPFTSGVPQATETATGLTTSTSTQGAMPHATGAIAMGALFGGVAVLLNV